MAKSLPDAFKLHRRERMVTAMAGFAEIAQACRELQDLPATTDVSEDAERRIIDLATEIALGLIGAMPAPEDVIDALGEVGHGE